MLRPAVLLQVVAALIHSASALTLMLGAQLRSLDSSFVSTDGLFCAEADARVAEGSLALKKAGPKGALFNTSFAHGVSCLDRGYELSGGEDACYVGLKTFFRNSEEKLAFEAAEDRALNDWALQYAVDDETASLMAACTCQPGSPAQMGQDCGTLEAQGSWVHVNPVDGSLMMCDEGPFVHATYALAVLKSTAQLPMHEHDQIRATSCAELGFPTKYPPQDHCFPQMHIWTRDAMDVDLGVKASQKVETTLFNGAFALWANERNLNVDILSSRPGCHCLPGSSVAEGLGDMCELPSAHSPIRDWWVK